MIAAVAVPAAITIPVESFTVPLAAATTTTSTPIKADATAATTGIASATSASAVVAPSPKSTPTHAASGLVKPSPSKLKVKASPSKKPIVFRSPSAAGTISHKKEYSTPDRTISAFAASPQRLEDVKLVLSSKDSVWTDRILALRLVKKWAAEPEAFLASAVAHDTAAAKLISIAEKEAELSAATSSSLPRAALPVSKQMAAVISSLTPSLVVQLSELRSAIIKDTCDTIMAISAVTQSNFSAFVFALVPPMLALTRNTKKAMSEPAHDAMKQIVIHSVGCTELVTVLLETAINNKSDMVRQRSIEYLSIAFGEVTEGGWPIVEPPTQSQSQIESTVAALFEDQFRPARTAAINLFVSLWKRSKERMQSAFTSVPARTQKLVLSSAPSDMKSAPFFAAIGKAVSNTAAEGGAKSLAALRSNKPNKRSASATDAEVFVAPAKPSVKPQPVPVLSIAVEATVDAPPAVISSKELELAKWKAERLEKAEAQSKSAAVAAMMMSAAFISSSPAIIEAEAAERARETERLSKLAEQRNNVLSPTMKQLLPLVSTLR